MTTEIQIGKTKVAYIGEVPPRAFRAAWSLKEGGGLEVDMVAARAIHRGRIRQRRAQLWRDIDGRRARALDEGNEPMLAQVRADAKALRDAPADPRIETAKTAEELSAIWPECLCGPLQI